MTEPMPALKRVKCRSCGVEIVFLRTKRGANTPVDGETVPADATHATGFDPRVHRSHFATCPEANKWRNRGKRGLTSPGGNQNGKSKESKED